MMLLSKLRRGSTVLLLLANRMIRTFLVAFSALLCTSLNAAEPPSILGVDHVGIATTDIERSIHFYRDVLGMELVDQGAIDRQQKYDRIFGLRNVKGKNALLRMGKMELELWEFDYPSSGTRARNRLVNTPGINHICFSVSDIQKVYKRLSQAGVHFHYPPQEFDGAKAVYGRDPDGNVFELVQWPQTSVSTTDGTKE